MEEKRLEAMCKWLKEEKGITKIDLMDLADYVPEFEEYLTQQHNGSD